MPGQLFCTRISAFQQHLPGEGMWEGGAQPNPAVALRPGFAAGDASALCSLPTLSRVAGVQTKAEPGTTLQLGAAGPPRLPEQGATLGHGPVLGTFCPGTAAAAWKSQSCARHRGGGWGGVQPETPFLGGGKRSFCGAAAAYQT